MTTKEIKEFEATELRIDEIAKCAEKAIYVSKRRSTNGDDKLSSKEEKSERVRS